MDADVYVALPDVDGPGAVAFVALVVVVLAVAFLIWATMEGGRGK